MPPALLATPSLAGTGIKFEKRLSRLCLIKRNTPVSQNISTHSLTLVKKKTKTPSFSLSRAGGVGAEAEMLRQKTLDMSLNPGADYWRITKDSAKSFFCALARPVLSIEITYLKISASQNSNPWRGVSTIINPPPNQGKYIAPQCLLHYSPHRV